MKTVSSEKTVSVGVIGLGAVGLRTLSYLLREPSLAVVACWDPDDAVRKHEVVVDAIKHGARFAEHAQAVIDASELVYIATPPKFHRAYAQSVLDAGKLCWCEKPLSVSEADGRAMVEAAARSGLPTAVNFAYASAWCAQSLQALLAHDGPLGAVSGIFIRLHFKQWPRAFQAHAKWLAQPEEGGFIREVLSHHIYLAQKLMGPLERVFHHVEYPSPSPSPARASEQENATEVELMALLRSKQAVPVQLSASLGGWRDLTEFTVICERGAARIVDWYRLEIDRGQGFEALEGDSPDPRDAAYKRQVAHISAFARGESHSWANFEDAWQVQSLVESLRLKAL